MQVTKWLVSAVAAVAFVAFTGDADAKRLGGSKSVGKQNSQVNKESVQQPASPVASNSAAAQNPSAMAAAKAPAAAAAATSRSRWLGPIAGLAAGLGLAALASHLGFGEGFANIMMIVLLGMIALFAIRFFMARRAAANQPALAGAGAGVGGFNNQRAAFQPQQPAPVSSGVNAGGFGATDNSAAVNQPAWFVPAGFNVEEFTRNAREHYIRLQKANDSGDLTQLGEFTTKALFAEISSDIAARQGQLQSTEIVSLNSSLVHFEQVNGADHASVRFTGVIRETTDGSADSIDEVWNLQRPSDASRGWVVAGIQQIE